jgi:hypothetical protein
LIKGVGGRNQEKKITETGEADEKRIYKKGWRKQS